MAIDLPLRWRLTLGFAAGMVLVLIASGVFVHDRSASRISPNPSMKGLHVPGSVRRQRPRDRGETLSSAGAIVDADDALAQVVDPSGEVVAFASPLDDRAHS